MSEKAELLAEATRLANNYQTLETIVNGMLAADNSALSAANAKIALLRAALEPFANRVPKSFIDGTTSDKSLVALAGSPLGDYRNAHATMEETK
jgi:hypothetical protein